MAKKKITKKKTAKKKVTKKVNKVTKKAKKITKKVTKKAKKVAKKVTKKAKKVTSKAKKAVSKRNPVEQRGGKAVFEGLRLTRDEFDDLIFLLGYFDNASNKDDYRPRAASTYLASSYDLKTGYFDLDKAALAYINFLGRKDFTGILLIQGDNLPGKIRVLFEAVEKHSDDLSPEVLRKYNEYIKSGKRYNVKKYFK